MPTWLEAITSPLNAATESIQKLMEVRDLAKFGDTLRKLHGEIVAAQASANLGYQREAALLKQIDQLEKEVTKFERWNEEKKRYEPKSLSGRAFVHMLKKDARGVESPHWVCTHCYGNGRAEVLQYVGIVAGKSGHRWGCPMCPTEILPNENEPRWLD